MPSNFPTSWTTRYWAHTPRWLRSFAGKCFAETPARLEATALHVKAMALSQQSRVYHATPTPTVRQCHKLQRYVNFPCFSHQVRTQKFKNRFCFSRHGHPRITGIDLFTGSLMNLQRSILNDFTEIHHSRRTPHRDLNRQPVRWVHNITSFRRPNVTDRHAAFAVKDSGCPRN